MKRSEVRPRYHLVPDDLTLGTVWYRVKRKIVETCPIIKTASRRRRSATASSDLADSRSRLVALI
jgi:hypothetical protein